LGFSNGPQEGFILVIGTQTKNTGVANWSSSRVPNTLVCLLMTSEKGTDTISGLIIEGSKVGGIRTNNMG
jgi:hypothetical protein